MGRTGHETSCHLDRVAGVEHWPDAYSESYEPILPAAVARSPVIQTSPVGGEADIPSDATYLRGGVSVVDGCAGSFGSLALTITAIPHVTSALSVE